MLALGGVSTKLTTEKKLYLDNFYWSDKAKMLFEIWIFIMSTKKHLWYFQWNSVFILKF
jgi:hypothetical protein